MRWWITLWLTAVLVAAASAVNGAGNAIVDSSDTTEPDSELSQIDDETTTTLEPETTIDDPDQTTTTTTLEPDTTTNGITTTLEPDTTTTLEPETTDPSTTNGQSENENVINTTFGPVQGYPWHRNNGITGFYDIPYGTISKPLQSARRAAQWTKTHKVRDHEKHCPQLENNIPVGDIDCLTLSIFKPLKADNAAVLFHIHSENFTTGSGNPSIYGPDYLVANGIILVLPNYRLGPLGFLCMQNNIVPGNMALKDLSLALNWIHGNIEKFGGDPNNIAVSGEGRSGALAGLLALSPMSKKYVNKVFAESGSFLSDLSLDRNPNITALELLDKIIETEDASSDISFDELDARAIVIASKGMEFKPCLEDEEAENAFMVKTPFNILTPKEKEEDEEHEKETIDISFLIGSAKYAGAHEALGHTTASIRELNDNITLLLPKDLIFNSTRLQQEAAEAVKEQYFGNASIRLNDWKNMSLYLTDIGYLGPGIRSTRLLVAAGATVYFYEFAYVGKFNRELELLNRPFEGAVRGDIVGYLFTQDDVMPKEENERDMVEMMTEMWTNFFKKGSPSTEFVTWEKLEDAEQDEEPWVLIDAKPEMQRGLHEERMALWTEIYKHHFIDNRSHKLSPSLYIAGFHFILGLAYNIIF